MCLKHASVMHGMDVQPQSKLSSIFRRWKNFLKLVGLFLGCCSIVGGNTHAMRSLDQKEPKEPRTSVHKGVRELGWVGLRQFRYPTH